LRHAPADAGLLNNLGLVLKELGDTESALDMFRQALKLDSRNADVYNNLAITLNRMHDYAAAIDAYRHSVELDPHNVGVLSNLAVMLEQTNRLDENRRGVDASSENWIHAIPYLPWSPPSAPAAVAIRMPQSPAWRKHSGIRLWAPILGAVCNLN